MNKYNSVHSGLLTGEGGGSVSSAIFWAGLSDISACSGSTSEEAGSSLTTSFGVTDIRNSPSFSSSVGAA